MTGPASTPDDRAPTIRPLAPATGADTDADTEASACAAIMATSEPWRTFGRTYEDSYRLIRDPNRETFVAVDADGTVAGFAVVVMQGAFVGYIQSVAVRADRRGSGLGTRLIEHAERRILREQPNVFICVSSFNPGARRLYERLGYQAVGELADFIVRGHAETLMRKTTGPLHEHSIRPAGPD